MKSKKFFYIKRITDLLIETNNTKIKVNSIATQLGITKKTLYAYFNSKQHLSECILDSYLKNKVDGIKEGFPQSTNSISYLIHIGHGAGPIFRDCSHLLEKDCEDHNIKALLNIFMEYRKLLIDMLRLSFNKGIKEGLIESDVDTELASHVYLSGVETLYRRNGLLNSKIITHSQISHILFYMIKGNCTQAGLNALREKVNIKIMFCWNAAISPSLLLLF